MYCPNCGIHLSFKNKRCDECGEDLKVYRKIISTSNHCYNDGLEKAKVRDLTGAVISLTKCLQFNKRNTNARNLLGLVYYEMGETVSALSQWVISKHFQNDNNLADEYMDELQSNPNRLETVNQTIKKFNLALSAAKQGNEDLAFIQLKKVVSLNPNFLRALQLLSLLYIKAGEKDKAFKHLKKALRVDVNNTTTLQYLQEIKEEAITKEVPKESAERKRFHGEETPAYRPISTYKEDKPNILAFINLIIGVIIGLAGLYFLVVPTIEKKAAEQYQVDVVKQNEILAEGEAKVSTLEQAKTDLEATVKSLKEENKKLKSEVADKTIFDNLFTSAKLYIEGNSTKAVETLLKVSVDKLDRPQAKSLYNVLKAKTFADASNDFYKEGYRLYSTGKYDEAIAVLEKALSVDPDNVNAIYFMARAYDRLGKKEDAVIYYNKVVKDFPDSDKAKDAGRKLSYLQ